MGRKSLDRAVDCSKASDPGTLEMCLFTTVVMLFAASMVYVLGVVQRMSPPVVALDIMRSLQITPDSMSLLFVGTTICYGLMQPVAGFWADRFGPRRCLLAAAFFMAVGSLVFSLSQNMALSLAARLCIGAAAGMSLLPCIKLAGQWLPARQFGLATSTIIATGAIASFIVGRPLAQFSSSFGWRWSFGAMAIVGMLLGILVWFLVRDVAPKTPKIKVTEEEGQPEDKPKLSFLNSMHLIVRQPEFWLLAVLYCGTDIIYASFMGLWAGPYLTEVYGLDEVTIGNMISISAVSLLLGPPLMVLWSSLWRSYGKVIFCMTLLNVVIISIIMMAPGIGVAGLYALCFIAPAGAQVGGLIFVMSRDMFPEHLAASSMGALNLVCVTGGAIMQQIIGYILTKSGEGQEAGLDEAAIYSRAFSPVLIMIIFSVFLAVWQVRKERVGPMMRP